MFEEKQINAYRNIKAPDRIYKRLNKKNRFPVKILSVVAACLVCVLMISGYFEFRTSEIKINGQMVENTIIIGNNKARSTEFEISFEITKINKKTEITVSEGRISFDGKDYGTVIVEDDATVIWHVEKDDLPCEISISDRNWVKKFTFIYENEQYILRRNEK